MRGHGVNNALKVKIGLYQSRMGGFRHADDQQVSVVGLGDIADGFVNMLGDGDATFALQAAGLGRMLGAFDQILGVAKGVVEMSRLPRSVIRGRDHARSYQPPLVLFGYQGRGVDEFSDSRRIGYCDDNGILTHSWGHHPL